MGAAARLRVDARLFAAERLRSVPERGAGRPARCARAGVRALRRAHAGASLRPTADGARAAGCGRGAVEHDVQGVRGLLGLRAAAVPGVSGPTKGKVESGREVLQAKLPGRPEFRDDLDLCEQLAEWAATVAGVRVHGTTHERPMDRFAREHDALVPSPAGRAFRLEAPLTRVVATDYLVSVDTNRYSVPFTLIGQPMEVLRRDGHLEMRHRGQVVATHPVLGGRHQLRILPDHGPGPIARNARARYSTGGRSTGAIPLDGRGPGPGLLRGRLRPRVRNDDAATRGPRRAPAAAATAHDRPAQGHRHSASRTKRCSGISPVLPWRRRSATSRCHHPRCASIPAQLLKRCPPQAFRLDVANPPLVLPPSSGPGYGAQARGRNPGYAANARNRSLNSTARVAASHLPGPGTTTAARAGTPLHELRTALKPALRSPLSAQPRRRT